MAEKPVSIPGTIKWQPDRFIGGDHTGAAYLYATNRYGAECCLGKWESPEDAKGTPYEREVAEAFAAADRAQFLKDSEVPDPKGPSSHQTGTHDAACAVQEKTTAAVLPEAHSGRLHNEPPPVFGLRWHHDEGEPDVGIKSGWRLDVGPVVLLTTDPSPHVDIHIDGVGSLEERLTAAAEYISACAGTGRKTEESDGKQADEGADGEAVRSSEAGSGQAEGTGTANGRPPGIPASATIWAEVTDGLGRKVGAWFEPRDGEPVVRMKDPDGGAWYWDPGRNGRDWDGDFEKSLTPSAAAQCRQLYERGMAEMAARRAHAEQVIAAAQDALMGVDSFEARGLAEPEIEGGAP